MKNLRKSLIIGVMALTVLGMSGLNVKAAAPQAGDLIKMDGLSAVYFLGNDGKRYVFPTSAVYFSWHKDFSGVVTISSSELQSYPLGGNIAVRPGTKLVKITTDPSVYAVEANGTLRKIQSEADAIAIYGANWAKRVIDVPDAFFTNYTIGTPLTSGTVAAGTLVKNANSAAIYYFDGTNYRSIATEAAFNANRFDFANVVTLSSAITAGGTAITGAEFAYDPQTKTTGPVVTGSGLTASISSATPAAANVPQGAALVPFTSFNLTAANDGAINVNSITVTRIGVGSSADLSDVYLYEGETRLTSSRTISASTNKATFAGLNIVVPAGSTKTITVRATVDKNATTLGNNAFSINAASDIIASSASISGSFPIAGNNMSLSTSAKAGVIAYSYQSVANTSLKVGEKDAELAKIKLDTAGSGEDMNVQRITLINNGSAKNTDVANLKLYRDSDLVSSNAIVNNDKITFVFATPMKIEKGNTRIFTVKGDVIGGASNTIKYEVDDATDVVAIGATYGYAANATYVTSTSSNITINAGELTLELNGPASYNITNDTDNANLANITVTTKGNNPVEVKTIYGQITASATTSNVTLDQAIENVQLVNTDSNQYYDVTKVSAATSTYAFKVTSLTFPAGVSHWKVEFDTVKANVVDGEKLTFSMTAAQANGTTGIDAKNSDNKVITDINPGSIITGNNVTITLANASVAAKTLSDGTAVAKTKAVKLLQFTVKAGNSSDVKVKEVDTMLNLGAKSDASNYTLWMEGATDALKAGVNPSGNASSTINFTGLNNGGVTIAKGVTKTFYVTADLGSTLTNNGHLVLGLVANGVKAEDPSNGNDVTPTVAAFNGRNLTLADHGTIALTVDSSSVTSDHIVTSGATGIEVLKVKADASNENVTIKTLKFKVNNATSSRSIAKAGLYQGSTLIQEKSTTDVIGGNTYVVFDNLDTLATPLVVNSETDSILTVKLDTAHIGTGANDTAVSGDAIRFDLAQAGVEAVGYSSNKDLTSSDITASITGKNSYVYANKVIAVKTSGQPTNLSDGEQEILKFSLTPSGSDNKVAQLATTTINLSFSGSGMTLASGTDAITLYQGSKKVGTYTASAGQASGAYTLTVATPDDIATGGETYVVKVKVAGSAKDYKLTANIKVNGGAGADNITWIDNKDNATTASWIDLGEGSSTTSIDNSILY